jgi:hypothetical protein
MDHLHTLNDLTPKIRCKGRSGVDPNLIFGVESRLFLDPFQYTSATHNDEVETATVYKDDEGHRQSHDHMHDGDGACGAKCQTDTEGGTKVDIVDENVLAVALNGLSKEIIWRVKGFVRFASGVYLVNWAFGRNEMTKVADTALVVGGTVKLTMMGEKGSVAREAVRLGNLLASA